MRYLTNIANHKKPIVEEAIRLSGRSDIHIDDEPMPPHCGSEHLYISYRESMRDRYFSVYVDQDVECGDFWNVYDELVRTDQWKVYMALVTSDPTDTGLI